MILSAKQLKKINCWTNDMKKFSGYTEADLKEVVDEVKSFALEINPKFISTLKYKFSKPEYLEVAKLQFQFWAISLFDKKLKDVSDIPFSMSLN